VTYKTSTSDQPTAIQIKGRSSTTAPQLQLVLPHINTTTTKHHHRHTRPASQQPSQHRNHGCPRSIRKLQRVGAFCPASSRFFTKKLYTDHFCARRVGVFATLTNSYALVAVGASENFYR
jgi:hypothetical protein